MANFSPMNRPIRLTIIATAMAALLLAPAAAARTSSSASSATVVLTGNVLHSIAHLQPVGSTDGARVIGIGVGLQGNDPAGEAAYIAGEYNPASPLYGQYLAPDE